MPRRVVAVFLCVSFFCFAVADDGVCQEQEFVFYRRLEVFDIMNELQGLLIHGRFFSVTVKAFLLC